jgi:hypothetical protein
LEQVAKEGTVISLVLQHVKQRQVVDAVVRRQPYGVGRRSVGGLELVLERADRFEEAVGSKREIPVKKNAEEAGAGADVKQLKGRGAR